MYDFDRRNNVTLHGLSGGRHLVMHGTWMGSTTTDPVDGGDPSGANDPPPPPAGNTPYTLPPVATTPVATTPVTSTPKASLGGVAAGAFLLYLLFSGKGKKSRGAII